MNRHPEFWLDDGNLILVASQETAFRIYTGLLASQSEVFANMFAGHLLIVMFTIATWYLANGLGFVYAGASFLMTIAMTAFELFIQAIQAYVFVLLACNYVQGALAEHH